MASASNSSQMKLSLKLMVHKEENRVIFAEADSHFIDTLFSIMTLPMATIVRLLRKLPKEDLKPIGSLNNLYESLRNLSSNCLSEENKWILLNPRTSSHDLCRKLKLNIDDTEPLKYFICQSLDCSRRSGAQYSTCNLVRCSYCGLKMDREIKYEDSTDTTRGDGVHGGVFVSDFTTFIVTDDLRVMPNSLGSSIKLLGDLGVTDVSQLENRTFDVGLDQIFNLLKGALLFKNPLTYMVFPSTRLSQDLVNSQKVTTVEHITSKETANISKSMKLKVTLQKSSSKFLFAEADSDFVEFVFGFLEIPFGTAIGKLMNSSSSFESLNNLYASISTMSEGDYIGNGKNLLLQPQLVQKNLSVNQIFPLDILSSSKTYCHSYLKNGTWSEYMTSSAIRILYMTSSALRKGHEKEMFRILYAKDQRVDGRYIKATGKFMVTDDLVITPFSITSFISMLFKLSVPSNDVEEYEINIGIEEGLKLLEASMKPTSTLMGSILKGLIEMKN